MLTFLNGKPAWQRIGIYSLLIFALVLVLAAASFLSVKKVYSNKVYPRIYLADQKVAGFSPDQLNGKIASLNDQTLTFNSQDKKLEVKLIETGISIDRETTYSETMNYGRSGKIYNQFYDLAKLLVKKKVIKPALIIDQDKNASLIDQLKKEFDKEAVNAEVSLQDGQVVTKPETIGYSIGTDNLIESIKERVQANDSSPLNLEGSEVAPNITESNVQAAKDSFLAFANKSITLDYNGKKIELSVQDKFNLLAIADKNGDKVAEISEEKIRELIDKIAAENDVAKVDKKIDPVLQTTLQQGKNGTALNQDEAAKTTLSALNEGKNSYDIKLPVDTQTYATTGRYPGRYVEVVLGYYYRAVDYALVGGPILLDAWAVKYTYAVNNLTVVGKYASASGGPAIDKDGNPVDTSTPQGEFKITQKSNTNIPWWQRFYGAYGLHGGYGFTFGCVSMENEDAEKLYNFTEIGTPVYIDYSKTEPFAMTKLGQPSKDGQLYTTDRATLLTYISLLDKNRIDTVRLSYSQNGSSMTMTSTSGVTLSQVDKGRTEYNCTFDANRNSTSVCPGWWKVWVDNWRLNP